MTPNDRLSWVELGEGDRQGDREVAIWIDRPQAGSHGGVAGERGAQLLRVCGTGTHYSLTGINQTA